MDAKAYSCCQSAEAATAAVEMLNVTEPRQPSEGEVHAAALSELIEHGAAQPNRQQAPNNEEVVEEQLRKIEEDKQDEQKLEEAAAIEKEEENELAEVKALLDELKVDNEAQRVQMTQRTQGLVASVVDIDLLIKYLTRKYSITDQSEKHVTSAEELISQWAAEGGQATEIAAVLDQFNNVRDGNLEIQELVAWLSADRALTAVFLSGEKVDADLSAAETVPDVRQAIALKLETLPSRVRLLHGATELQDSSDLSCLLPDRQLSVAILPQSVHVLCRIRPFTKREIANEDVEAICATDTRTIEVHVNEGIRRFNFGNVLQCGSQEEVFQFCKGAISAATAGLDSCVIAYGQTGAGKTYSMFGPRFGELEDESLVGVANRFAATIFSSEIVPRVSITILELRPTNTVKDLLQDNAHNTVQVRGKDGGLEGCIAAECATAEDLVQYIGRGFDKRRVAATMMSANSSRSHLLVIFTLTSSTGPKDDMQTGRIVLADLAGSERVGKCGTVGASLPEARCINSSLSSLRTVMDAYAQGSKFIPYRDSKLTLILKSCLPRTFLICACSPASSNVEETIDTLRFAERVQG